MAAPLSPKVFGRSDGLRNESLTALAQDSSGVVWATTPAGLFCWMGGGWELWPGPEVGHQPNCNALVSNASGLWVGTVEEGLLRLRDGRWATFGPAKGRGRVDALVPGPEGEVFVRFAEEGLFRIRQDRMEKLIVPEPVGHVVSDGDQPLYLSEGGLFRWVRDRWVWEEGPGALGLCYLCVGRREWVGTRQGLYVRDRGGAWVRDQTLGLQMVHAAKFGPLPEGGEGLWLATAQGPFRQRGAGWVDLLSEAGLPSTLCKDLLITRSGGVQVWAAGIGRPTRWAWPSWIPVKRGASPEGRSVTSFVQTPEGDIWISDRGGSLHPFRQGRWLPRVQEVEGSRVGEVLALGLLPHPEGPRPVAFLGSQTFVYHDGGAWRRQPVIDQPKDWGVNDYLPSQPGARPGLFIASQVGVFFLDAQWNLEALGALPTPVQSLSWDPERPGELWACTAERGLWRFRRGAWEPIAAWSKGGHFERLLWVRRAAGLRVFAASLGQGLLEFDPRNPELAPRRWAPGQPEGWPSTQVVDVISPDGRSIWALTDQGVAVLGEDGRLLALHTENHGLPSRETCANSAFLDREGRLWIGTLQGPAWIRPESLAPPPPLANPVWVGASTERGPIHDRDVLPWGVRNLHFTFLLPQYGQEASIHYRHQLVGLDKEPSVWRDDPKVAYHALGAGSYVLRVWATDGLGQVTSPIELRWRVRSAPWAHPLAWLGYLVLLGGIVVLAVRQRTRRLARKNWELALRVEEATQGLRLQSEGLQAANEKLALLNDAKNRVIGVAAHDLRTPLAGVILECQYQASTREPERRESTRRIQSHGRRMQELIEDLLNIHAIEVGQAGAAEIRSLDPGSVVREVQSQMERRAARKGQSILVEPFPSEVQLQGDPRHLGRILENYLSNALKFAPPNTEAHVRLRAWEEGWRIEVEDEGPGLTEEDKERVFGLYARLSARPTAGEPSVGLGLSIVRDLAEGMGARVGVESQPGQGAIFWVWLPTA